MSPRAAGLPGTKASIIAARNRVGRGRLRRRCPPLLGGRQDLRDPAAPRPAPSTLADMTPGPGRQRCRRAARRQRRASMATIDTTAARLGDPGIGAGCSQEAKLPRTKDKAFTRFVSPFAQSIRIDSGSVSIDTSQHRALFSGIIAAGTPGPAAACSLPGNVSRGTWHRLPRQTGIEVARRSQGSTRASGTLAARHQGTKSGRPPSRPGNYARVGDRQTPVVVRHGREGWRNCAVGKDGIPGGL
jgi:hypothetical protein